MMSGFMALRKLKASSLLIIDSNDEDIEMQPLEISGTTPQLRRRQLSMSQAFRMAFFNNYGQINRWWTTKTQNVPDDLCSHIPHLLWGLSSTETQRKLMDFMDQFSIALIDERMHYSVLAIVQYVPRRADLRYPSKCDNSWTNNMIGIYSNAKQ
jgi:hypothetical protein